MSMNRALNATIALIEGRTDIAKEIIRDPLSDVKDVPAVLARLDRAVNMAAAKAIRNSLVRTLAIQTPNRTKEISTMFIKNGTLLSENEIDKALEEVFYLGVSSIETLLDKIVDELESK